MVFDVSLNFLLLGDIDFSWLASYFYKKKKKNTHFSTCYPFTSGLQHWHHSCCHSQINLKGERGMQGTNRDEIHSFLPRKMCTLLNCG